MGTEKTTEEKLVEANKRNKYLTAAVLLLLNGHYPLEEGTSINITKEGVESLLSEYEVELQFDIFDNDSITVNPVKL